MPKKDNYQYHTEINKYENCINPLDKIKHNTSLIIARITLQ